jgi:signal transduction histidine kinase
MKTSKDKMLCWKHFQCNRKSCPAYKRKDALCWLVSGTNCNDMIQGGWLEKMEVCLKCEVFQQNIQKEDLVETLQLVSEQFASYRKKIADEQNALSEAQKKLQQFKTTSIYLLKALDSKSDELAHERNTLEERVLQKTQELEAAYSKLLHTTKMAAIGRFASGIAHEINNPLGAIINYVRNLTANPELTGKSRGYLELTLKGLFRIENIVQRLLNYAGKHPFNPQPVQVNKLIQDTLAMHKPKLTEKNIRIETDLQENMPEIEVDPFQLQQVFSNLILNAYDALPNSGRLTVTSITKKKQAFLSFIDNGPGIPEQIIDQVFDPFFTTKEVGKGTGLGLFISYNIIQILGGNIDIKSQPGKGTQIHITIPLMPEGDHHE